MYIIDFDGTLVDVWNRYYTVFNDFWEIKDFGLIEYKYYKKKLQFDNLIVKEKIGLVDEKYFLEYQSFKKSKLENFEYLKLDKLIVSREWIKTFFSNEDSMILTIRNNRNNLIKQLDFLEIAFIESKVVSLSSNGTNTKLDWVNENMNLNEKKTIVGDSETDFKIGLLNNTKVYLVETGLRNPDSIISKSKIKGEIIADISCLNNKMQFDE